jgi:hypothetical protein
MMFKKIIFCILLTLSLKASGASPNFIASADWKPIEDVFQNTHFSFQMPGIPEKQIDPEFSIWKTEDQEETHWLAIEPVKLSKKDAINMADIFRIVRRVLLGKETTLASMKWLSKESSEYIFKTPDDTFFICHIYRMQDLIIALVTHTSTTRSSSHEQFIESLAFSE